MKCTNWKQQNVMRLIYAINEDLKQIHRSRPIYWLNDVCEAQPIRNMCPRARARTCAFADPCGDAKVFGYIVFSSNEKI